MKKIEDNKSNNDETIKGDEQELALPNENSCSFNRDRRDTLKYMMLAAPAMHGIMSSQAVAADTAPATEKEQKKLPPQVGDRLTYYSKKKRGPVLKPEDLEIAGKQQLVLPVDKNGLIRDGSRYNQILVQRFEPSELEPETKANSAEGIVAYSAICTHAGCSVTGWMKDKHMYMCPCHQTVYNPKNSANIEEGPAPRRLPSLPLKIDNGEIVVAAAFNSRVGFGKKRK